MNKNILIVSGHPDLNNSFANRIILDEIQERLPESRTSYLDRLYPDYKIDVATEQQKLIEADVIVLQFPFYWYSIPALMKKWIEDVFVHGFSHGSTGNKLHGKKLIISFTSGAPEEMYKHDGLQNYTIEEFIPPLKQFANLCGLEWVGFVYTGGLSYLNKNDEEKEAQMKQKSIEHAERLVSQIRSL